MLFIIFVNIRICHCVSF